jgi:hypothetical protein
MKLFRVHAYSVEPERTADTASPSPFGGGIRVNKDIAKALEQAVTQSNLQRPIAVDLQVDTTTRTSDVRNHMLFFAFENKSKADSSGKNLATKLSQAMDLRSSPCLFVVAALKDGDRRSLRMWTFPREEAFQFRGAAGRPSIQLLTDIFSRTSRLRKAALFEGENRKTDFIGGKVFDFQASSTSRDVADFWIVRFLGAVLAVHGPTGTRHLARCLREAYEKAQTATEQEQIYSAVIAVRHSHKLRWSLREFADHFLSGKTRKSFIGAAPNQETIDSSFDFDRGVFDSALNFRIFGLNTGVFVSTPLGEVGKSVVVSGTTQKVLRCEGTVVEEHLRMRHV